MQMSDLAGVIQLQNNRLFTADTPMTGQSELVMVHFHCTEGLSMLYDIDARFASQDPNIQLKQMIGQPVTISLEMTASSSSQQRYFHGYVTNFSHLDTDGGLATYGATIRPWLWMLSRRQDIRIFQEQTAQDVLTKVFQEYGALATYEFRLSKATANRSYCTQYRETDLDFALRLMQEEGLFFFFEHAKTGHKLIISDTSTNAKPIDGASPTLTYLQGEATDDLDVVTSFQASRQLSSGSVSLKTADYKVPAARRFASDKTDVQQGSVPSYEVYDYLGAHAFPAGDRGDELATFRAEALAAGSKIFAGSTTSRRLAPMRYFELDSHYDHDDTQAEDRQFMLMSVTHSGQNNYQASDGAATYACSFTCIRKKIPYRPAITIEPPFIPGPQTAVVVGPAGEEIYTDTLGRVKVQFPWDRLGKKNQSSSCWVRVGQPWAGRGFGAVQIPRIGDEVVVSFLDGNPDRPLITSRVYNAQNMPPWSLPANATQSGFLTRSSKGATAANANAIRFEDKMGQEELWIHAEKDQRIEVENDESHTVGVDRSKTVGHDETVQVKNDRTETVGNNETITVVANRTEQVGQNETLTVGGNREETIRGMQNLLIMMASSEEVGLAKALVVGGAYSINVVGAMNTAVGLVSGEEVGMSKTTKVGKTYSIHAGDRIEIVTGKASLVLESSGKITLSGTELLIEGSGAVQINGKDVDIN
ncbi:type VI secretion system Vgr family protein [Paraburkholderia phosphatilytica]|uniref:type VI secretion system Vgr family protein n=1 Tax=Paraburkholderia phosphatilytica TaxID=2282883 RepID=UPI000E5476C0|nr:type VI secretion system Vgr family protein [Paraburkholderia phosphatilytica]